ncbi:MAG: hypothetical protein WC505_05920 [Patescibacteria group bacterium]
MSEIKKPEWQRYQGVSIPGVLPEDYRVLTLADFYLKLAFVLLLGRANDGTTTDQQDDAICAFMDEIWEKLSQQDRNRVKRIERNQESDYE